MLAAVPIATRTMSSKIVAAAAAVRDAASRESLPPLVRLAKSVLLSLPMLPKPIVTTRAPSSIHYYSKYTSCRMLTTATWPIAKQLTSNLVVLFSYTPVASSFPSMETRTI